MACPSGLASVTSESVDDVKDGDNALFGDLISSQRGTSLREPKKLCSVFEQTTEDSDGEILSGRQ